MKKTLGILFFMMLATVMVAQQVTVTGRVTSRADGLPIPGVSVVQNGTTIGTITDVDGNYTIPTEMGETLTFSFIGLNSRQVVVNDAVINIEMEETYTDLDEVIVVGYGVQKRSVVTAAISSVSAEDLAASKPSRIEDVLKGKVSGVQITQSSGQPGSDSKVRIRGIGTINNSDPLFIVDGMAVDGGIRYLNPSDIQSVEILKDAASAAVYGARAANGVVLVTTKQGQSGKTTVNYDFSYGWQNPWTKKSVLDGTQYMVIMNEALRNDGSTPRYSDEEITSGIKGTDWQDETFNYDAPVQNHQVSVQGGSDKGSYFMSFGYFNQEGIVGGNFDKSNFERWSIRSNNTYTVFETENRNFLDKVRVGINAGYTRAKSTSIDANSEYGSILGSALSMNPLVPVYALDPDAVLGQHPLAVTDKDGRVFSTPPAGFQEIANPVGMLNAPSNTFHNEDKFVSTFWGEIDVFEGLKFKSSYGVDLAFWGQDGYTFPHFLATQGKNISQSSVNSQMNRGIKWQLENTLSYAISLDNRHNFTLLAGQSAQEYSVRELRGTNYDLLEEDPSKANINYGIADPSLQRTEGGTGGYSSTTLASYFGRIDYNFEEKYMLQATVRRDGSSRFGPENKWAIFPSVSAGWNITNESFMDSRPEFIDHLRLRASWGRNGNENIDNFRYTSLMDGNQNYYFGNGEELDMHYGASPSILSNPYLKWEESEQLNVGFEARFLRSAISFGADYYIKSTNGMLMQSSIPRYVGKQAPWTNIGEMENWGLEFELGYRGNVGEFSYSANANATYSQNKLINLGNDSGWRIEQNAGASGLGDYVKSENGEVFPYFYGFKTNGIFQNQAQVDAYVNGDGAKMQPNASPGDVIFVDANGDGVIDNGDRVKIGKGMPDWTYGLTLGAEFKGFDLNAFFQGTLGNDIYDFSMRGDIPAMNRPSWILDRWTGEGTSNSIPRMTNTNRNENWRSSDLYIKDGSYLRLKTVQLGYTLPQRLTNAAAIDRFRIYVAAENLLTFTSYEGFDPEIASGDYTTIGIDRGIYPQARTISIGANITF